MVGNVVQQGNDIFLNIDNHWYQYQEKDQIGGGAMGTVYRGYDCQTGEPVAVKRVIDRYANNPEIRRRAHQEAELMFRHPNLVEMIGYCEVAPNWGPIFIVSNFVQGENIDDFINAHVRSLPNAEHRICELFLPVLDALAYIHQKGIIHMDIKPSNIMMESGRNVRLMDLGIAGILDTFNTASSGMMGTPKYAAPEQFSNIIHDIRRIIGTKTYSYIGEDIECHGVIYYKVDGGYMVPPQLTAATDIYEAGVTLYELLTNENPFSASTVAEARELHNELVLDKLNLSAPIYQVISKATAIDPRERYQSASEMKKALTMAISEPPPPPPPPWLYIVLGIGGGLILIIVLILLIIV